MRVLKSVWGSLDKTWLFWGFVVGIGVGLIEKFL